MNGKKISEFVKNSKEVLSSSCDFENKIRLLLTAYEEISKARTLDDEMIKLFDSFRCIKNKIKKNSTDIIYDLETINRIETNFESNILENVKIEKKDQQFFREILLRRNDELKAYIRLCRIHLAQKKKKIVNF